MWTTRVFAAAVVPMFLAGGLAYAQSPPVTNSAAAAETDPPCFDNFNRYVDCWNGTVTDTVTGLIWLQDATCFGVVDWASGNTLVAGLADGQCGLMDGSRPGQWRLPTAEEWQATMAQAIAMGCSLEGARNPPGLTNDAGTACLDTGPSSFAGVASGGYWSLTSNEQHPEQRLGRESRRHHRRLHL